MLQFKWIALEVEWVNMKRLVKRLFMYKGDGAVDTFDILEAGPTGFVS